MFHKNCSISFAVSLRKWLVHFLFIFSNRETFRKTTVSSTLLIKLKGPLNIKTLSSLHGCSLEITLSPFKKIFVHPCNHLEYFYAGLGPSAPRSSPGNPDKSIKQSINISTSQYINQSVKQPIKQPIHQSINQSDKPFHHHIHHSSQLMN